MSKVAISEEYLTDIADSIREKLDTQDTYKVSEMSEAIDSISGGGLDWSAIGYSGTPQTIIDGYNYAVQIKNNWDATQTSLRNKFSGDINLVFMPAVDTSNATTTYGMFQDCSSLLSVPLLNVSSSTTIRNMFNGCVSLSNIPLFDTSQISANTGMQNFVAGTKKLTDESLNNILKMCINATSYSGTKTLNYIGIYATYYPATRIQALPSYQDFIDAGWTIGY